MGIEIIKWIAVGLLIAFIGYTIFCVQTENFWKSCRTVWTLKWGRQVTIDLYLGLLLFTFLIYLNEQSFSSWVLWFVPTRVLGN
ncbi:MAG: hypothetical protein AB7P49_21210, partial [Bdellovibrionales bacterium]